MVALVTLALANSATKKIVPPSLIFQRVNFRVHVFNDAAVGSHGFANPTGRMKAEHFLSLWNISFPV
jgi:hypothetical protein